MTLEEIKIRKPATITIQETSKIMKVSPQFLRSALIQEKFPFGVGVQMEQKEYYINAYRFLLYMEGADIKLKNTNIGREEYG